jgi:hypothetical protein
MTFSIHQPNYIPWIGYFYKIYRSDVFIYLDSVQYPRGQSYGARNTIKTANGPLVLTIPVSIEKGKEGKITYLDVKFSDPKWKVKHQRTLEANYKKAPFYNEVMPLLQSVFDQDISFAENNIQIIEKICNYVGITSERKRLSELLPDFGQKTGLIIDIGKAVNGTAYLCGDGGGTEYTEEQLLAENNIALTQTKFHHPTYKQLWAEPFVSHLSMLDLLFNEGKESLNVMLSTNSH